MLHLHFLAYDASSKLIKRWIYKQYIPVTKCCNKVNPTTEDNYQCFMLSLFDDVCKYRFARESIVCSWKCKNVTNKLSFNIFAHRLSWQTRISLSNLSKRRMHLHRDKLNQQHLKCILWWARQDQSTVGLVHTDWTRSLCILKKVLTYDCASVAYQLHVLIALYMGSAPGYEVPSKSSQTSKSSRSYVRFGEWTSIRCEQLVHVSMNPCSVPCCISLGNALRPPVCQWGDGSRYQTEGESWVICLNFKSCNEQVWRHQPQIYVN